MMRKRRTYKKDLDIARVVHEYRDLGMTSYELAEKYGVDPSTIRKWMRGEGVSKGKDNGISHGGGYVLQERMRDRVVQKLIDDGDTLELLDHDIDGKFLLRCKTCGHEFLKSKCGYSHKFTCPHCYEEDILSRGRNGGSRHQRRMRIPVTRETYDRTVTLDAVFAKHRGICCECGRKTVRSKSYTPLQATLDHIVALNNGGTHTWDNVQLLCSECNSSKRDLGQMRLAI